MTPSTRTRMSEVGISLGGAGVAWLLLTLLHGQLERLAGFDLEVQAAVHAHASRDWTAAALLMSWIGATKIFMPVLAVVSIWMVREGRKHSAGLLAFAMAGAYVLNETLKLYFHRARPQVSWAIRHETTYSFPSGHALFATVLYGTMVYLARRGSAWLLVAMPLAIGLSRVYLGVHYPTDVLAGYVVGLVWLGGVVLIDRLRRITPA